MRVESAASTRESLLSTFAPSEFKTVIGLKDGSNASLKNNSICTGGRGSEAFASGFDFSKLAWANTGAARIAKMKKREEDGYKTKFHFMFVETPRRVVYVLLFAIQSHQDLNPCQSRRGRLRQWLTTVQRLRWSRRLALR